jgi:hypothetical protein
LISSIAFIDALRRGGRTRDTIFGESGSDDDDCDDDCDDNSDDDNSDDVDGNDSIVSGVESSIVTPLLTVCKRGCVAKSHEHV